MRLLIVDDDPTVVEVLKTAFTIFSYECHTAMTGDDEALEAVEAHHPHLVLLDAILPGTNGFEVCRKIKTGAKTHQTRVVMISGYLDETDKGFARICGADGWVVKPFSIEALRERVETVLAKKR